MFGQLVDRRGQDGDLHVGGTRVVRPAAKLFGKLVLVFFGKRHDGKGLLLYQERLASAPDALVGEAAPGTATGEA